MPNVLFWNIAKRLTIAHDHIVRLTHLHNLDILLLAECVGNLEPLILAINSGSERSYRIADAERTKVRVISRLPETDFFPHFSNVANDMTIWNLSCGDHSIGQVQLAVVHLLSKAGGASSGDQLAAAIKVAGEIREYEDEENCFNTILVGDVNMNPYDEGIVQVAAFNAAITRSIALKDRQWRKEKYRKFYNPMWSEFGDRNSGPPGTFYWDSSVTHNHYWHILDQVLVRPDLINTLTSVRILDSDGEQPLVNEEGIPSPETSVMCSTILRLGPLLLWAHNFRAGSS